MGPTRLLAVAVAGLFGVVVTGFTEVGDFRGDFEAVVVVLVGVALGFGATAFVVVVVVRGGGGSFVAVVADCAFTEGDGDGDFKDVFCACAFKVGNCAHTMYYVCSSTGRTILLSTVWYCTVCTDEKAGCTHHGGAGVVGASDDSLDSQEAYTTTMVHFNFSGTRLRAQKSAPWSLSRRIMMCRNYSWSFGGEKYNGIRIYLSKFI
jgi:hypothetical protein